MHRALLPSLVAGLFLSACDEATLPTEISPRPGDQPPAPSFAAITQHESSRSQLELFIFDPCTEDDLELTGETIFQSTTTQLPSGELRIEGLSKGSRERHRAFDGPVVSRIRCDPLHL